MVSIFLPTFFRIEASRIVDTGETWVYLSGWRAAQVSQKQLSLTLGVSIKFFAVHNKASGSSDPKLGQNYRNGYTSPVRLVK